MPRPPRGGGYPAPPPTGPLPKPPNGAAPGSARREPALRYEWGARCTCGDRIRVQSSTPWAVADLAAVWRQQHRTCEPAAIPDQPAAGCGCGEPGCYGLGSI